MHYQPDRGFQHPVPSEITPKAVYESRRDCLRALALGAAGSALGAWASRDALASTAAPGKLAPLPGARSSVPGAASSGWFAGSGSCS
jgi:sulfoxide reductase catalytic subunit YedY